MGGFGGEVPPTGILRGRRAGGVSEEEEARGLRRWWLCSDERSCCVVGGGEEDSGSRKGAIHAEGEAPQDAAGWQRAGKVT